MHKVITGFLTIFVGASLFAEVVINEIHYNSRPNDARDEFVELLNTGNEAADLSGWFFNDGIEFVFPQGITLPAGGFLVVAQDPAALQARYGVTALGPFGGSLSGDGERISIRRNDGSLADEVDYQNNFPWPTAAGGAGPSMELVNPNLDNDLGGSWRSSQVVVLPELTYFSAGSDGWRWRPGSSEASTPLNDWTGVDFVENGNWISRSMPIGYGLVTGLTFSPPISGMQRQYTSVFLRKEFEIAPGEVPQEILLRYLLDDGMVVYVNGNEVFRNNVPAGQLTISDSAIDNGNETVWFEAPINGGAAGLREGTNVIAIHAFNRTAGNNDFGLDIELIRPEPESDAEPQPSPGLGNTVFSEIAPPAIRQVDHSPRQPAASEQVVVTAKVTDPDGVASVVLEAQVVAPGAYVPAFLSKSTPLLLSNPTAPRTPNPAYEQNWTTYTMVDDGTGADEVAGDGIYAVELPGQPNRTLVRYRITVTDGNGAGIRVPYEDDDQLNFAWFTYDGVPDYQTNSGTFPASVIESIPVYHVLTTSADFNQMVGYNGGDRIPRDNYDARSEYNWNCTFVYEGRVYDNARFRLRQRNARYAGNGKRSLKFRFNRGSYPTFRDRNGKKYSEPWRFLATHKMVGSRSNPTWGLDQSTNHLLWNLTGTPAPFTHWAHFRVVQSASEYTNQYQGDYYGMLLALEEYDARFLDSHNMEKGNLYKLISGRTNGLDVQRYQAADSVNNASDFSTIINQLRPQRDDNWLRDHVNWESWNHYHAVVDMIRHYDVRPNLGEHLKNRAYYFEPSPTNPLGRLNVLPWDSDTSWGPNWNDGLDFPMNVVFGGNLANPVPREPFSIDYLNTVREMRDLIWTPEQVSLLIDPLAAQIDQIVPADRARWIGAPGGGQVDLPIENVVADMKRFAFDGGSWVGGTNNLMPLISRDTGLSGQQGRDAYLDALVNDPLGPAKPTLSYSGNAGFPQDGLAFTSSAFSDPQGSGTFQAMEWRLAEVTSLGGGSRELMPEGRMWSYRDDNVDLGTAWREPDYDDSAWATGASPAGFGLINGLNLATTTTSRIPTAYYRTVVDVPNANLVESLTFRLLVDDGAVVYLNGQEVLRKGFDPGEVVTHESLADNNPNEDDFEEFEVGPDLLVEGANVIAIQVHNRSIGNNDMGFEMSLSARDVLLAPGVDPAFEWASTWESGELTTFGENIDLPTVARVGETYRVRVRHQDNTGRWSNWSDPVEFVVGEPSIEPFVNSLVISQIMYHPLPPSAGELAVLPSLEEGDFEWLEIMNIGSETLDLTDIRLTKGVDFDFVQGRQTMIAPGERLVVVANEAAFNLRHGYETTPSFVVGEFSRALSNGGELVRLTFGAGTLVREVTYGDEFPWPDSADGLGPALVLAGGFGELATDWRPSVSTNGAPGIGDGLDFSGDLTDYALLDGLEIEVVDVGGNLFVDLTFTRRLNADAALIDVESAGNLESWSPAQVIRISESYGPEEASTVTYRTVAPLSNAQKFFRLKLRLR